LIDWLLAIPGPGDREPLSTRLRYRGTLLAFDDFGRRDRPAVVLVHGWPLDRSIWSEVAPRLASAGFRVLAPDLPGFGESQTLDTKNPTVEGFADAIASFMKRHVPRPAALVGHSFGGYVALAMAERTLRPLSGLGLVSSRAIADSEAARKGREETIGKVRAQGTAALLPGLAQRLLGPTAPASWKDEAAGVISRAKPDAVIAALRAMASRPDRSDALESFKGPLLILHGDADALIPITEISKPSRHVMLRILPDVGHMPMWEAPESTAAALNEWARAAHRVRS